MDTAPIIAILYDGESTVRVLLRSDFPVWADYKKIDSLLTDVRRMIVEEMRAAGNVTVPTN